MQTFLEKRLSGGIKKNMVCPSSTTYTGYNHWLVSYPAHLKSWKLRQKTVNILSQSLAAVQSSGINF